jgi:hypothetical protein
MYAGYIFLIDLPFIFIPNSNFRMANQAALYKKKLATSAQLYNPDIGWLGWLEGLVKMLISNSALSTKLQSLQYLI